MPHIFDVPSILQLLPMMTTTSTTIISTILKAIPIKIHTATIITTLLLILKTTMITIRKDGNVFSASIPCDSNIGNASPKRNNMNNTMRLPRFISHPNGIVLRLLNHKQSTSSETMEIRCHVKSKFWMYRISI